MNRFSLFFLFFWGVLVFPKHTLFSIEPQKESRRPLCIVAAENFYGNIAQQIGGSRAAVTSIMNSPTQDPHEFQVTPAIAKIVADADIVIKNGAGYDTWMDKLLANKSNSNRIVITVADFSEAKLSSRENPHFWYAPSIMLLLADKLATLLKAPSAGALFHEKMQPLFQKITELRTTYPQLPVTATEPLFTPMAEALGWQMLHEEYQWAIMNETEPSFQELAAYHESLKKRTLQLLLYNKQVITPSTSQLKKLAEESHIPVIGITELQPSNIPTYQEWMLSQLLHIEEALTKKAHE